MNLKIEDATPDLTEEGRALARIENDFTYHVPFSDQVERYRLIRDHGKAMAREIVKRCPPSRERSLALTKIEESVMWANASIARNEKPEG